MMAEHVQPDPTYLAITEVREMVIRMDAKVSDVPAMRSDIDSVRLEQAEHRGAINLLKWLFPATIGAVAAATSVVAVVAKILSS